MRCARVGFPSLLLEQNRQRLMKYLQEGKSTGMKCLPHSKITLSAGMVLHDCHAEVEFLYILLLS